MKTHKDSKTLLILAAGMGSRYGGLKQLDPVGPHDETILDYSIFDAIEEGFDCVVFVIRRSFEEEFQKQIVAKYKSAIDVRVVFQELDDLPAGHVKAEGRTKPWGTGQAVLAAKAEIGGAFAVINADDFYGRSAFKVASQYMSHMKVNVPTMAMVGYPLGKTLSDNGTVSRGLCLRNDGCLAKIVETHGLKQEGGNIVCDAPQDLSFKVQEDTTVSMNFWIFSPAVFEVADQLWLSFLKEHGQELKSEFYIPSVAQEGIQQGLKIDVLDCDAEWMGVTYQEDREGVRSKIQSYHDKQWYPEKLQVKKRSHDMDIRQVFEKFNLLGDFVFAVPYGSGHINQTYAMTISQGGTLMRYILQRINKTVFQKPRELMENIERVLEHAQQKLSEEDCVDASSRAMTLIKSRSGQPYVVDADDQYWRCYIFIEGATGHDIVKNDKQAYEAAKAFGKFQSLMSDLPGEPLHETIPNFHYTPSRYQDLLKSINENKARRLSSVSQEVQFFMDRADQLAYKLLKLVSDGEIPMRVTHNDTKLNNVLLNDMSHEGQCVIDLDTTMPGVSLYDFGDLVRTSTSPVAEDEVDVSLVKCQLDRFEALVRGYLETAKDFLTKAEIENIVFSGKLITYEVGMRFLTDYLNGDVYFKVSRDHHNLDRCRTQMALIMSIEQQESLMNEIVLKVVEELDIKMD